jgi:hypothetical protein
MPTVAEAVARAGIIDPEMVQEIRKWGLPVDIPEKVVLAGTAEEAVDILREAIEGEDQVEVRETVFGILEQYLRTKRRGKLFIVPVRGDPAELHISFGREKFGNGYIIPWPDEVVYDMLTNGLSYLLDGRSKIYFNDARKTFFGKKVAFIVCVPVPKEAEGGK